MERKNLKLKGAEFEERLSGLTPIILRFWKDWVKIWGRCRVENVTGFVPVYERYYGVTWIRLCSGYGLVD
jgi:hypothetical protein